MTTSSERLRRARAAIKPRPLAANVVVLLGALVLCAGVAMWSIALALVIGGVLLVAAGQGIERS